MTTDTGPGGPDVLEAPLVIEYPFQRTTGPVIGAFFTALKQRRVLGIRAADDRIVCPPTEYDPQSGAPLSEMVEIGSSGAVTAWSWVPAPRDTEPLTTPHALALIQLDGADTSLTALVDVASPDEMSTGMRVAVRWPDETVGLITDIAVFEPAAEGSAQ